MKLNIQINYITHELRKKYPSLSEKQVRNILAYVLGSKDVKTSIIENFNFFQSAV